MHTVVDVEEGQAGGIGYRGSGAGCVFGTEAEEDGLEGRSDKLEVFACLIPLLSWCNCEGRNEQTRDVSRCRTFQIWYH